PLVRKDATIFWNAGRSRRMTQSEGRWGDPSRRAEACCELLRTAEAGRKRNFGYGIIGLDQPAFGLFEAHPQNEAMRRRPGSLLEGTQKMPLAETDDTTHRGERQLLGKIVAYVFLEAAHITRGQRVAHWSPLELAAPSYAGNMG